MSTTVASHVRQCSAPAEALPEESPPVRFTWVLDMVGANTDGTVRRENVWGGSSGGDDMATGTTTDTTVTASTVAADTTKDATPVRRRQRR